MAQMPMRWKLGLAGLMLFLLLWMETYDRVQSAWEDAMRARGQLPLWWGFTYAYFFLLFGSVAVLFAWGYARAQERRNLKRRDRSYWLLFPDLLAGAVFVGTGYVLADPIVNPTLREVGLGQLYLCCLCLGGVWAFLFLLRFDAWVKTDSRPEDSRGVPQATPAKRDA